MKTNSNFSIPRLARFIRFDFMSNLRSYIFRISLIAIIMLLCMILGSIFISGNSFNSGEQYISTISSIASTAFVITIMVSLSLIFEPMKTVGGRINHLMLPASKAEKFVGRLLISTIGIAVAFIMALLVAECVRNVTLLSFGSKYSDVLGFYFPGIMANMADSLNPAFAVVSIHIFNLSAFLLGGALWYNYSFVKTDNPRTLLLHRSGTSLVRGGSPPRQTCHIRFGIHQRTLLRHNLGCHSCHVDRRISTLPPRFNHQPSFHIQTVTHHEFRTH